MHTKEQKKINCVGLSLWLYDSEMWLLEGRKRCLEDESSMSVFLHCLNAHYSSTLTRYNPDVYRVK